MFRYLLTFFWLLVGCGLGPAAGSGGGQDSLTVDLPFAAPYHTQCVQGAGGSYSHSYSSTRYDLDLDTPNDRDDPVFSPVSGTAYVHDDGATGFGRHVNVDLGDGTFLLLGHMKTVFVKNGSSVTAGSLLGLEGMTGNATGDHVHIGRHRGDAKLSALSSTSIEGLALSVRDVTAGTPAASLAATAFTCSLGGGHVYESALAVPHRHPEGTLLKGLASSTIYRVESGVLRMFMNESAFLSRKFSFNDVVFMTNEEQDCYEVGAPIVGDSDVRAGKDSAGQAWLLLGRATDSDRSRTRLPNAGWQSLLKSWGITVATYDELPILAPSDLGAYPSRGTTTYRMGSLVSPLASSDVYVIGPSVAAPIVNWDELLFLGFAGRTVIEVNADEWAAVAPPLGNCVLGLNCLTRTETAACTGALEITDTDILGIDTSELDLGGTSPVPVDTDVPYVPHDTARPPQPSVKTLSFTWRQATGGPPQRITLSGEFTPAGGAPQGWNSQLAEVHNLPSVIYHQTVQSGDRLRLSVEFDTGSTVSWSCLGPFPPGRLQGIPSATVNGAMVLVVAAADPTSAGCGLSIVIP